MKKFIMSAVMAIVALTASAQKGEYYITPHLGFGYMNMSNMDDLSGGIGGTLGVDFEYMVADQFGISAGLDAFYGESNKENDCYFSYGYLNIPVLAQYHFGNFAVKAGLQPAFIIDADAHTGSVSESFKDGFNSFSLALPVGISYTFNTPITLDLRCAIPLTKQNKESEPGFDDCKLTTVMLSVGYRF